MVPVRKAARLDHIREVSINEISLQPPQTVDVMITRTNRLAVKSSRQGCALGGKSRPSSDPRVGSETKVDANSTSKARPLEAGPSSAKASLPMAFIKVLTRVAE
jgi:hypothetical protein